MAFDPEVAEFYARHCAFKGAVVLVTVFSDGGEKEHVGVFSNIDSAKAWSDRVHDKEADVEAALFSPYIIDVPDYGNIPSESVN